MENLQGKTAGNAGPETLSRKIQQEAERLR